MISKYRYNNVDWIDVQSPTKEEVYSLVEEYSIPAIITEELITETVRSKVDLYENLIYLVLHFPVTRIKNQDQSEQEIDFIVGKNFLITIHYELINPLHEFFKKFEVRALLNKKGKDEHAGHLFYHIIKELYRNVNQNLETINPELKKIERNIFEGKEKDTVKIISEVNRKLLNFKQAMRHHYEALKSFESAGKKFFEPEFSFQLEAIIGEYNKIKNAMDSHKEIITDLRETNDSLLANKTNETMKILTIITFMISPVTVISSIFMMNTDFVLIQGISEFYIVLGAMILTSIITFIFFKTKKWL
ncbi:MAG: CorA family divalent cation transporter [Patescibacteria group bacterium]